MTQLADATARWNAGRIDAAVTAWNADPTGSTTVSGAVQDSGKLTGYLFGNLERASVAAGAAEDARLVESANQLVTLASAVVGLIPGVGPECPGFAPGWGLSDQAVLLRRRSTPSRCRATTARGGHGVIPA